MSDNDTAVSVEDTQADSAPADELLNSFEDYGTESSTVESPEEASEEPADQPSENVNEDVKEPEQEESEDTPKDEAQDPSTDWDKLNGKSQDRFRQMANENRELKRQYEELQARQAQFATEQQLLDQINPETGEYYTTDEVARIAHFQRLQQQQERTQQEAYQMQVRMSQNQLLEDGEKALRDFPMFDASSDKFDPELSALVDPILQANAITDPNTGEVLGMRVSPYTLLKTYHDALSRNSHKEQTIGRAEAQRATEKMLANVDHAGSASGATEDDDTKKFIDNFFD